MDSGVSDEVPSDIDRFGGRLSWLKPNWVM